jgi:hypothetical protein
VITASIRRVIVSGLGQIQFGQNAAHTKIVEPGERTVIMGSRVEV